MRRTSHEQIYDMPMIVYRCLLIDWSSCSFVSGWGIGSSTNRLSHRVPSTVGLPLDPLAPICFAYMLSNANPEHACYVNAFSRFLAARTPRITRRIDAVAIYCDAKCMAQRHPEE